MARVFIDTNVFVYAIDPTDPEKHARARDALGTLARTREGFISTQVVAEFVSVVGSKLRDTPAATDVSLHARAMLRLWPVFAVGGRTVALALEALERHALSYWDAQILASAILGECDTILTEDRPAGNLIGVRYEDPFTNL